MTLSNKFSILVNRFLDVPSIDPDDSRRRKILNVILAFVGIAALFLLVISPILSIIRGISFSVDAGIYITAISLLTGTVVLIFINRTLPGWVASTLFLILLMVVFYFSDTPEQLVDGRSLFVFTIPIIMASMLLRSTASFLIAALVSVELYIISAYAQLPPLNFVPVTVFFMIAAVSWLSSRSLEQTLKELREINKNLDGLVEQKTNDLALSLSRELVLAGRNRTILESIADGVVVFDIYGKAIQINAALSTLLGIPYNDLAETTINDLTRSKSLNPKSQGILMGLLASPEKHLSSHRIEWDKKTLSISSAQVFDDLNAAVGTVAVFRDFTREADVEKMKSTFVAMISHELRTPLNGILGYAEMFKEAVYGPVNEKQANMSERIMKNAQRLIGLLNDLLDQAQIEAGKLAVKSEAVHPKELLENLHGTMDKIASDKNLALISTLDPSLPETIKGDNSRLQQILINLVNNAIKFTDNGSIKTNISRPNLKEWSIEVTDTGSGIPENEIQHIFETFRQVDGTITRQHGGFGLGLSIVKQLVELMSGEIKVKSVVGSGSTFTVILPLEISK
ncbi:MAG: hypothetical protein H7Y59_02320 [Anaerolineales bacterium]|nr:hypothetical protein [Anaerolineales bacterium]